MSKKKRKLVFNERVPSNMSDHVDHDRCVYCGKQLADDMDARHYALAKTRYFPVCDDECARKVEEYIAKDAKYKTYLYVGFFLAALAIFIVSFFNEYSVSIRWFLIVAGSFMTLFPYPVTSFETFMSVPIRTTTIVTRLIGVAIIGVGVALQLFS